MRVGSLQFDRVSETKAAIGDIVAKRPPVRRRVFLLRPCHFTALISRSFSKGEQRAFVHISAVEKAGLDGLPDGAKVTFDIVPNRGKESAENLRVQ